MAKQRFSPPTDLSGMIDKEVAKAVSSISDISIDRLIEDGLLVLSREIANLKRLSVSGKLDPADARDLRDHLKVLFELKAREADLLKGKTDDELQADLNKANNGNNQDGASSGSSSSQDDIS